MSEKQERTGYQIALERIAMAKREDESELYLSDLQLTELPPEVGSLTKLQKLYLNFNQLTALPPEISLLSRLEVLDLRGNQLMTMPPVISSLAGLESLLLDDNLITTLPPEIGSLIELKTLKLSSNFLTALPSEIGSLTELDWLDLAGNRLATLAPEIGLLPELQTLFVDDNPLPLEILELARAFGSPKLIAFLRQTAQARNAPEKPIRFDEAKVLFLGSGEVGKTWLLQALQGKVPQPTLSTKGIEIARVPLDLPHPSEPARTLHLNCWDFGGQDFYQITHQIFFSARAVYLLIWKPRIGIDPGLVERLERIKVSAGRTAKVLIVSTHADDNVSSAIGQDALREQFGDLIGGFYAVDSAAGSSGTGMPELRTALSKAVAQLEGLDFEYPPAWRRAREAIAKVAQPTMNLREFADLCTGNGLDADFVIKFAEIMEIHGKAVFFADAESDVDFDADCDNLIVLNPEWLAKAVGFVIEDQPTRSDSGILQHKRLNTIWAKDAVRNCPGYPANLFGYLLWLMWKFDIAYKQDDRTSLIPEHIGRDRPDDLHWTPSQAVADGDREATLICSLPHNPPVGLIPALTAAVHPLRRMRDPDGDRLDRNWRDGFFLDTALRGAAFAELRDRDLWLVARAKYPANLLKIVRETLHRIVQSRWEKLKLDFRVPCLGVDDGEKCRGSHRLSWLERNRGGAVDCETCQQKNLAVDPMLDGFNAQHAEILAQLADLQAGQRSLQTGQRELLASAHAIFKSLDVANDEIRRAPCLFTFLPEKAGLFSQATHEAVRITCWCEHPDGPHPAVPIGAGLPPEYVLTMPRKRLVQAGPYLTWSAKLLKAFVPLAGTVVAQGMQELADAGLKDSITMMNDAVKALPSGELELAARGEFAGGLSVKPEGPALRVLHDFLLDNVDAKERWGDLRPILTKSGQILWLCPTHAAIQQPPVQTI